MRIFVGILLLAAIAVVVRWHGEYPTVPVSGIAVSSSDSTPLTAVPIGSWAFRHPVTRQSAVTDTQGHFLLSVPLFKRVVLQVGGDCHDPVRDTIRVLGLWRHLGLIPLERRPGGRPAEHVVCQATRDEDGANRPLMATILSSTPVQDWIATWARGQPVTVATTALQWGSTLMVGDRALPVIRPASFGVMLPSDGSSLLDLHLHRTPGGRACALLRGFPADQGTEPEDLVMRAVSRGGEWTAERSDNWPGCG